MKGKSRMRVHFIGVGGIGMSALARWFQATRYVVQGSDIAISSITKELAAEKIKVFTGAHDEKRISPTLSRVIYNQAILETNPELIAAKKQGIPTNSYPQSIGELTKMYRTIAIAGAHGKSTTTALIALILEHAKFDPTVIIGTKLKEFGNKNFRKGTSDYLVLEADEWKASFLNYFPYAALITNIDREHLDYYKNLNAIKKAFLQFIEHVNPEGFVVLNKDNALLWGMRQKIKRPVVWYSLNDKERSAIEKKIKIAGLHNLSNAIGAYTLARALGIKKKTIIEAISKYQGSWRRMEYRGKFKNAAIYDDYAHHPAEIAATIAAFKNKLPDSKIICVFQPHQRERLKLLFKDFTKAFNGADTLILWEVYDVAGREEEKNNISSKKLAQAIERRTKKIIPVVKNMNELKNALETILRHPTSVIRPQSSVIIMMGAGNINEQTEKLIK